MSTKFQVNGKAVSANAEPDTPLLWVIRDELGMTGTKFGCGAALCELSGERGAASVVRLFATFELMVDDVGCVSDIDTVDDLRAAERLLRDA